VTSAAARNCRALRSLPRVHDHVEIDDRASFKERWKQGGNFIDFIHSMSILKKVLQQTSTKIIFYIGELIDLFPVHHTLGQLLSSTRSWRLWSILTCHLTWLTEPTVSRFSQRFRLSSFDSQVDSGISGTVLRCYAYVYYDILFLSLSLSCHLLPLCTSSVNQTCLIDIYGPSRGLGVPRVVASSMSRAWEKFTAISVLKELNEMGLFACVLCSFGCVVSWLYTRDYSMIGVNNRPCYKLYKR
jgi:hypothetical protein